MNLETKKLLLIQEFLKIDDEKLINALGNFLHKNNSVAYKDDFKSMSLKQLNDEIDTALEDEKNGRILSAEELKDKIQEWT